MTEITTNPHLISGRKPEAAPAIIDESAESVME